MDYLIKALFLKSAAISIAAVLSFSSPAIIHKKNKMIVLGKLRGICTQKVKKVIHSGGKVHITFYIAITAHKKKGTRLITKRLYHSISFNAKKKIYIVRCQARQYRVKSLKEAARRAGEYKAVFSMYGQIKKIDFYEEADIGYNTSMNIDFSKIALWDDYIPAKKISGIPGEYLR